jgi:signal transduction histidine kinase
MDKQRDGCEDLIDLVQKLGDSIRKVSSELRPDMLDHLGLIPTLEWFIDDFVKRIKGLDIDFQATGMKKRPPPEIEIVIYRVLQEALNNIAKHARARRVSVLLAHSHPNYIFTIKDDGIGIAPTKNEHAATNKRGIGLLGMRERVGSIGGNCEIRSNRGKGTVIRVELPDHQENAEARNEDSVSR